jgi:hypothetical protein
VAPQRKLGSDPTPISLLWSWYLCLDRSQQEQEIMACLLTSLEVYGSFSSDEIASGLDVLIARFDDVLLDAPEAAMVLAVILAHLILDGTLPESYLVKHASSVFPGAKVDLPLELPEVGLTGVPQMLSFSSWMLYGKIPLPLQQMKSMIRSFVQSCLLTGESHAVHMVSWFWRVRFTCGTPTQVNLWPWKPCSWICMPPITTTK